MIANLRQNTVRSVSEDDRQRLANLVHFEAHIHRHLDWRSPLDWVGNYPYLVVERNGDILAALACPPDPPDVAWIRLFAVSSEISVEKAWEELWPIAQRQLAESTAQISAAAIPLQHWFRKVLEENNFVHTNNVVVLTWKGGALPEVAKPAAAMIRLMNYDDLTQVEMVDTVAFGNVWQNSQSCLEVAFRQASIATVAEISGEVAGYQISTITAMGGHLARLAVKPKFQGLGVGYALVCDMLSQFERRNVGNVTVNTQDDNMISLSLYQKAGFSRSGEKFPVFQCPI
ncbi:MAG: GNAT family N-acetyltransferase [Anaerolineales bacterium]|nr:GNAT family N-acetyltransferase [Anaerolineales bacterium]